MSEKLALDANSLQWRFGTLHENMPGQYVDELVRRLLEIPLTQWPEACRIWVAGRQAGKFPPEEADLIVRLARMCAGRRIGT